jgi:hypothetical protein
MEISLVAPHRGNETSGMSGAFALINLRFCRASPDGLGDCPPRPTLKQTAAMRKSAHGKDAALLPFVGTTPGVTVE